jgi:hypothetical protein
MSEDATIFRDKLAAELMSLAAPNNLSKRLLGVLTGHLHVPDTFDAPLTDDELADFEGR